MPEYRRAFIPGGTFFFTLITNQRRTIFVEPLARQLLKEAIVDTQKEHPFEINAISLLPEHLHCIWTLPEGDHDYPGRWKKIKTSFSKAYLRNGGLAGEISLSKAQKGEVGVWQRRYWEHTIYDWQDLKRHIEYIHYNPVKHGLVKAVVDWPWSSFHRYVAMGYYDKAWGGDYEAEIARPASGNTAGFEVP